jgi:hypothetical protein
MLHRSVKTLSRIGIGKPARTSHYGTLSFGKHALVCSQPDDSRLLPAMSECQEEQSGHYAVFPLSWRSQPSAPQPRERGSGALASRWGFPL